MEKNDMEYRKYLVILGAAYGSKGRSYKKGETLVLSLKPHSRDVGDYLDSSRIDIGVSNSDVVIEFCPAMKILFGE